MDEMIDLAKFNEEINAYIKPLTFPVAVKMLREGEEPPAKARSPHRDLHKKFATCQAWNMVRKFGWVLYLTKEDMNCSPGCVALGFQRSVPYYEEGNLAYQMYNETLEAGAKTEAAVDKFPYGGYTGVVFAATHRADFEPDLILIYGNSAQVMRLLHGRLYKTGGRLTSSFQGRLDCADIIVTTLQTDECQIILPCYGDRIFGQTQDDEMAFTVPRSKMEMVVEGLKGTHKGGVRYPIPSFLNYEAVFPPTYEKLKDIWKENE